MPRLSQTHSFLQSPSFWQAQSALIGQLTQCIVIGWTPQARIRNVTPLIISRLLSHAYKLILNSFPPTFPEDLLAHASPNDWPIVAKHANTTRPYKMRSPRQYVRIFFLTLLNLDYDLNYYSSQLRFAHSRAGLMAALLQRSREYDIFLKIVRLPSDHRWTFRTQVMSSCRLISAFLSPVEPAGQDISPASHVPLSWWCGEPRADAGKGISRRRRCSTEKPSI